MRRLPALSLCLVLASTGFVMSSTALAAPATEAGYSTQLQALTVRKDALAQLALHFTTLAKQAPPADFTSAQKDDWHQQSLWYTSVAKRIHADIAAFEDITAQLHAGKLSKGKARRGLHKVELNFNSSLVAYHREADKQFEIQCPVIGTCSRKDATMQALAAANPG